MDTTKHLTSIATLGRQAVFDILEQAMESTISTGRERQFSKTQDLDWIW
ncbi:hypothetical protein [Photobacterium swingsii]